MSRPPPASYSDNSSRTPFLLLLLRLQPHTDLSFSLIKRTAAAAVMVVLRDDDAAVEDDDDYDGVGVTQ
ncbi:hypothetical protein HanPSC8_Chr16g0708551 [Helianthus annuus]|nr:hypothetical protein HanPSC8_Chr16g0708551 [Helianthus annuus]